MEEKEDKALDAEEGKEEDFFATEVGFDVRDKGIFCWACYEKIFGNVVFLRITEIIHDAKSEKDFRRGTSGFFVEQDEVILCAQCWRVILRIPPSCKAPSVENCA